MSQRGGDVQSHLRLSDREIHSDLIPHGKADLIISVEPMEALRYLPWLSPDGWVVTSSVPYVNIPDYPDPAEIMAELRKTGNTIVLDADAIAKDLGSSRSGNMVILGAASSFISVPLRRLRMVSGSCSGVRVMRLWALISRHSVLAVPPPAGKLIQSPHGRKNNQTPAGWVNDSKLPPALQN